MHARTPKSGLIPRQSLENQSIYKIILWLKGYNWTNYPNLVLHEERTTAQNARLSRNLLKLREKMPVEVHEIIRSKRKTIALIVRPDGSIVVRAPLRAPDKSIREFVAKNIRWIEKKQAQARAAAPALKQYISGERFEFLGNAYPLEVVNGMEHSLILQDGKFTLAESMQDSGAAAFEHWYRKQARIILQERVNLYARLHGFQYTKIRITSARTRWGSCSATGSVNFSWRLVQAPREVVDYVVVHELVHTVFHDHSKRFWKRVAQVMPDYQERRKWLRKHGLRLLL